MVPSKEFLDELAVLGVVIDEDGGKPFFRHSPTGEQIKVFWSQGVLEDVRVFHGEDVQLGIEQAILEELRRIVKEIG